MVSWSYRPRPYKVPYDESGNVCRELSGTPSGGLIV